MIDKRASSRFHSTPTFIRKMPQSLDDLPNELLEQIASDTGLWERRPPPSSNIFGVLSRVNRRLRGFALPHLFETLHLPLTDVSFAVPTISAGPFARLLALIRSDSIYKNSIRYVRFIILTIDG